LYSDGVEPVEKDEEKAIANYSKACNLGMLKSCMNLASKYFNFDSNNASSEDQENAYINYMKVCDKGTAEDCYKLGFRYAGNYYFNGDKQKASEFFKKSCEKGDKRGCEYLSSSDDKSISVHYSMKACDYGDTESCYRAGRIYYYGEGNVQQDINKAKALYKKHCDKPNYFSQCKHGIMQDYAINFLGGEYCPQAEAFYVNECNKKNPEACFTLGNMYYEVRGIKSVGYQSDNWKQAKFFYGKACDLKYSKGCERYSDLKRY
jgi:TPR repeat protein